MLQVNPKREDLTRSEGIWASRLIRAGSEDAIYFEADKNRYISAVSLGFGPDGKRLRRKVSGKTKQEVLDKLKALHAELNAGVQSSAGYTVRAAVVRNCRRGRCRSRTTAWCGRSAMPRPTIWHQARGGKGAALGPPRPRGLDDSDLASDRAGGDTKTALSRRTPKLPEIAVRALRERRAAQAADRLNAGELWQDDGPVFTTSTR